MAAIRVRETSTQGPGLILAIYDRGSTKVVGPKLSGSNGWIKFGKEISKNINIWEMTQIAEKDK
jgi:hypothetical protein